MEKFLEQFDVAEQWVLFAVLVVGVSKSLIASAPVLSPAVANSAKAKRLLSGIDSLVSFVGWIGLLVLFALIGGGDISLALWVVAFLLAALVLYSAFLVFARQNPNP